MIVLDIAGEHQELKSVVRRDGKVEVVYPDDHKAVFPESDCRDVMPNRSVPGAPVGNPGHRVTCDLYCVSERGVEDGRSIYVFRDDSGNTLSWITRTSGQPIAEKRWHRIRATVKSHIPPEYKGAVWRTEITRVSVL